MRLRDLLKTSCRIVVTLLLVAALSTVLITPDTSDDVNAVMRSHQTVHVPILQFAFVTAVVMSVAERWRSDPASDIASVHSLQLLCTCRC